VTAPAASAGESALLDEQRSSAALLLALLGHVAMRRLRDAHVAHGLTPRQFHLLCLLRERGGVGQRELGQTLEIDPSILVTMLNPLEQEGLIARSRAADDRRCHIVSLTSAGERRLECAAQAQLEAEDQLFAGLAPERREQLRGLLVELQEQLAGDPCASCAPCGEDDADGRSPAMIE
jgi:DNA-binding MarR family transcriptional regulator